MQPVNPHTNRSSYFINPEEAAELARLLDVDEIVTAAMGGVLPAGSTLADGSQVLDVACGPGGWASRVAEEYSTSEIIGVDISQKMIHYARAHAQAQGIANAFFEVGDIREPLDFPDDAFDFVNARLISSFMPTRIWPGFVKECHRVTRPGGTIRLTEAEWLITNSPACEQLADYLKRAMANDGKSFVPGARYFGASIMIGSFLRERGLSNIQEHSYFLECSHGLRENEIWSLSMGNMYQLLIPYLGSVAPETNLQQLQEQAAAQMQEPGFRGGMFLRSVWGHKPR